MPATWERGCGDHAPGRHLGNGLEGWHVHGHDGVRDYWTRQWAMMDSRAESSGFSIGEDGTAYVEVHLTARDLHGNALFDAKPRLRTA